MPRRSTRTLKVSETSNQTSSLPKGSKSRKIKNKSKRDLKKEQRASSSDESSPDSSMNSSSEEIDLIEGSPQPQDPNMVTDELLKLKKQTPKGLGTAPGAKTTTPTTSKSHKSSLPAKPSQKTQDKQVKEDEEEDIDTEERKSEDSDNVTEVTSKPSDPDASRESGKKLWIVQLPRNMDFPLFLLDAWVNKKNVAEMAYGYGPRIARLAVRTIDPTVPESETDDDDDDDDAAADDFEDDPDTFEASSRKGSQQTIISIHSSKTGKQEAVRQDTIPLPDPDKVTKRDCFVFLRLTTRLRSTQFPQKHFLVKKWPFGGKNTVTLAVWLRKKSRKGLEYHSFGSTKAAAKETLWEEFKEKGYEDYEEFLNAKCLGKQEEDYIYLRGKAVRKWFQKKMEGHADYMQRRAALKEEILKKKKVKIEEDEAAMSGFLATQQQTKSLEDVEDKKKSKKLLPEEDEEDEEDDQDAENFKKKDVRKGNQRRLQKEEEKSRKKEKGAAPPPNKFKILDTDELLDKMRPPRKDQEQVKDEATIVSNWTLGAGENRSIRNYYLFSGSGGEGGSSPDFAKKKSSISKGNTETPSEESSPDFKSLDSCLDINNLPLLLPVLMNKYSHVEELHKEFPHEPAWLEFLEKYRIEIREVWEDLVLQRRKIFQKNLEKRCQQSKARTLEDFKQELYRKNKEDELDFVERNESIFLEVLAQKRKDKPQDQRKDKHQDQSKSTISDSPLTLEEDERIFQFLKEVVSTKYRDDKIPHFYSAQALFELLIKKGLHDFAARVALNKPKVEQLIQRCRAQQQQEEEVLVPTQETNPTVDNKNTPNTLKEPTIIEDKEHEANKKKEGTMEIETEKFPVVPEENRKEDQSEEPKETEVQPLEQHREEEGKDNAQLLENNREGQKGVEDQDKDVIEEEEPVQEDLNEENEPKPKEDAKEDHNEKQADAIEDAKDDQNERQNINPSHITSPAEIADFPGSQELEADNNPKRRGRPRKNEEQNKLLNTLPELHMALRTRSTSKSPSTSPIRSPNKGRTEAAPKKPSKTEKSKSDKEKQGKPRVTRGSKKSDKPTDSQIEEKVKDGNQKPSKKATRKNKEKQEDTPTKGNDEETSSSGVEEDEGEDNQE